MYKETKVFVMGMIIVSALFFAFNLNVANDPLGKAFYIADGDLGMTDTQYPYSNEVASVNTAFWGFILILMIGYIVTIHYLEHKEKKKK